MKQVTVLYFAVLREQTGRSEEDLQTSAETPRALYAELTARYGFKLAPKAVKVAINDDFAAWEHPLANRDRVVFIPPVAGG